jgi:hypothetical protein
MATTTLPGSGTEIFRRDRAYDNYFFSAMALLILVTGLVGFAQHTSWPESFVPPYPIF